MHIFFLELKTKGKGSRLNDNQKVWAENYHEHYAASNTHYGVAFGYADAKQQIIEWMS
jgi:hypothetical protein